MTDAELHEVEVRAKTATEGPWEHDQVESEGRLSWTVEMPKRPSNISEAEVFTSLADAEFIAHARADVPALVAEIRELRARLKKAGL